MKRMWTLGAAVLAALVLAACSVTVGPNPDPFPDAIPTTAGTDPNTAIESSSVAGNSSEVWKVTVPSTAIGGDDVVFFELDTEALAIGVYNSSGNIIASSSSNDRFVAGGGALALFDPAAISANITCRGSCVILPAEAGTFYVEVVNDSGSSRDYDLFVFGDAAQDTGEDDNDSSSSAPTLGVGGSQEGAIETLGDTDLYRVTANGTLSFSSTSSLDLIAEIVFDGVVQDTLEPGESASVFTGDLVRVKEDGGNAAGPAGSSRYALELTSSAPFPGAEPVDAGTDPGSGVGGTLPGSGSDVYLVSVSGAAASSDLLYLEVDTENAAIIVYNTGGTALASSTTADRFVAGGGAAARFSTSAIGVAIECRGSCVIFEATSASYYVEIVNETGSSLNYQFYAYGDEYVDEYEPSNDVPAGAPDLSSSDSGAIETLGDVDYFYVTSSGTLTFTSTSSLALRAEVSDAGGAVVATLSPGQSTTVFASDEIRVYESGGDAAAASSASRYNLVID